MSTLLRKRLFTVDEYEKMIETDILREDDRVELIEGEIVHMSPIGRKHMACVKRLNYIFSQRMKSGDCIVSVQDPIVQGEYSEPEPDIILLKFKDDFYEERKPQSEDVLLIIEVAETSLEYDLNYKIPLYARHNIPEVWIIELENRQIKSFQHPVMEKFNQITVYTPGQSISPMAFPDLVIEVSEILGSRAFQD